ncbi:AsmA-like C-terminal region-containing protein [Eudoraea adriatica]|uniref:AsmA-like C-terminal region-containing protein n=1 Tax=Eudoraea adriatica TaxID=446681 RepID=UPI0003666DC5|nr:AsmA-like C-terminal region-containing protein [Eudoraea adriatica]
MKKKILRITGILLLVVLGVLIAVPFFLEAKIGDLIKNNVNKNINATLDFSKVNLSLLRSFPKAELRIEDLVLLTKGSFEGDTLFRSESISLEMGIKELLKNAEEPIVINSLIVDGAVLKLKTDKLQNANYQIANKEEPNTKNELDSGGFTLGLESFQLTDAEITYEDLSSGILLELKDLEHIGKGDLSLELSELVTQTKALVSFERDSTRYLDNTLVLLDAVIGIDLKTNTYSFLKNEGFVNKLPLVFEGYVRNFEEKQEVDIKFKTPSSGFDNFLAVIPEAYARNIEDVKTTGIFNVEGVVAGILDDEHIPEFDVRIDARDASIKYPDLPKAIKNINMDMSIKNTSGLAEDTFIEIDNASFAIENDRFVLSARLTELLGNTKVQSHVICNMNLANISGAYPLPGVLDLKGLLDADINTSFDMESIEKKRYKNTVLNGHLKVNGLRYNSDILSEPLSIRTARMEFAPSGVMLEDMNGQLGKTDFNIDGTIQNLLGFLFNDENITGSFTMSSDTFDLGDFMSKEEIADSKKTDTAKSKEGSELKTEKIQIPAFLDCTIDARAGSVVYDNLILRNVKGRLRIVDQKAQLSNFESSLFDGSLNLNGFTSTKGETPDFQMQLGMTNLNLGNTFKSLELFRILAPMAASLEGKLNSAISISGQLNDDFTPDLNTITGTVNAEMLAMKLNPENSKIINALNSRLNFIEADKFDLKALKTALSFKDGIVSVKPFTINYDDIAIAVGGSHSFDKKLNYNLNIEVPRKYLGKEINSLIAQIDEKELENLTLPVKANVSGFYDAPEINTDLSAGMKDLTSRLLVVQKQKMINKGTEKAGELLGGILSGNGNKTDSAGKGSKENAKINEVLGGIVAGQTEKNDTSNLKSDSIAKEDPVTKAAKGILGGILGGKKKNTNESKAVEDTIN